MFYSSYNDKLLHLKNESKVLNTPLKVTTIDNAIALPIKQGEQGSYRGGFIDQNLNYYEAHKGSSHSNIHYGMDCVTSYTQRELDNLEFTDNDGIVCYGGVLFSHFGHEITEGISRLWYYCEKKKLQGEKIKLIFFKLTTGSSYNSESFLKLLGINKDDYIIVERPMRFKSIIIPDQSYYILDGIINIKAVTTYDYIINNLSHTTGICLKNNYPSKIYLSRSKFEKDDMINESFFEDFYSQRGYIIIYPEQLSIEEQILLLNNAEEIVCTGGTLGLLLFFARNKVSCTILLRDDFLLQNLFHPLILRRLNYSFVEANFNFLPCTHSSCSLFLMGPTNYFINFLQDRGIPFSENEVNWENTVKPFLYDYITSWSKKFISERWFKSILNYEIEDLMAGVNKKLLNCDINKKNLIDIRRQKDQSFFTSKKDQYNKYFGNLDVLKNNLLIFDFDLYSNTQKIYIRNVDKRVHYEIILSSKDIYIGLHIEIPQLLNSMEINAFINSVLLVTNYSFSLEKYKSRWIFLEKRVSQESFKTDFSVLINCTLNYLISSRFSELLRAKS